MLFSILTIDRQGCILASTLQAGSLEMGLEVLDELAAKGLLLVEVTLEDGASLIHLPVEAFDEHRCLPIIEQLEKEWRRLLSNPLPVKILPDSEARSNCCIARRIQGHVRCINKLTLLIGQAEQRSQRIDDDLLKEPSKSRIIAQLATTLTRLRENLAAEQSSLQRFRSVCDGL